MTISADDFDETVSVARDYLADPSDGCRERSALDFAGALVQVVGSCVFGVPCERHAGVVHGKEAEELRAGVEQIVAELPACSDDDDAAAEMRHALVALLDRVDARDSVSFQEAKSEPLGEVDDAPGWRAVQRTFAATRAATLQVVLRLEKDFGKADMGYTANPERTLLTHELCLALEKADGILRGLFELEGLPWK